MFAIVCLLNINFTMLRSMRSTLVVADLGGSSKYIPFFELFGTLPGAFLLTYILAKLLSKYNLKKVFLLTIGTFLGLFLILAFGVYPLLPDWTAYFHGASWIPYHETFERGVNHFFSLSFFVLAELWKVALVTILFWGLVNQYVPIDEAKVAYAPIMLASSIGAILAGPCISFCSSDFFTKTLIFSTNPWTQALLLMTLLMTISGILAALCYNILFKELSRKGETLKEEVSKPKFSVTESLKMCFSSPYLILLSWIVVVEYIAYCLGEIIFLDVLKKRYPNPIEYCQWLGVLSSWCGGLTAFSALVLTPWVLKNFKWVMASIITPFCVLITQALFFFVLLLNPEKFNLFGWTHLEWVNYLILFGSIQYALCRAAKYTLFDSSKELAFVVLPRDEKMKSKLVIDGIGSRLGRGGASFFSIFFTYLAGGVVASAPIAGTFAVAMTISWLFATKRLGKYFHGKTEQKMNFV